MAEKDTEWDDWVELQQAYWKRWSEIGRRAMGLEQPPADPWRQAMEHWWSAVSPGVPEQFRDLMEKMLDQSGRAFGLAREAGAGWESMLRRLEEEFRRAGTPAAGPDDAGAVGSLLGLWSLPLTLWQEFAGGMQPGEGLLPLPPALGFGREQQEHLQEQLRLYQAWQQALQAYQHFFADLGLRCVGRMEQRLRQRQEGQAPIESGRALYDEWTSVCEEVYAERVSTPEYVHLHGELVNAMMRVRRHLGEGMDRQLALLGLPTRRGLRSLQQRVQQDRRELRALRAEVDALRRDLAAGQPAQEAGSRRRATGAGGKVAVRKKAVVRKKPVVRKKATARNRAATGKRKSATGRAGGGRSGK